MRKVILMLLLSVVSSSAMAAKRVNITGQVFVVTQGRQNIKLALVEISAIPEKVMIKHIKTKHSKGLEQQMAMIPELESARAASRSALDEADALMIKIKEQDEATKYQRKSRAIRSEEIRVLEEAVAKEEAAIKIRKEVESKSLYFDSPEYYFENLPTTIAKSKTDIDGKFTLTLPTGKYVIVARSDRVVIKGDENYYWLVLVDTSSPNQSLMLSNDNLFETKCNECVNPSSMGLD